MVIELNWVEANMDQITNYSQVEQLVQLYGK